MPQKEILVTEVKLTADGKAFNVKDVEDTGYFCRDTSLLSVFRAGGPVIITYENKTGKSGKSYNNVTGATKKGQTAPQPQQTAPAPPKVEVSGPEHGMALKLVGDLFIAGKLKEDNGLVIEMFKELARIMGTQR